MDVLCQNIKLSKLHSNTGQIDGLPRNPRLIKDKRYSKLLVSLKEDPEMLSLKELWVYPFKDGYVVIAGNMRLTALRELKVKEAPCKVIPAGVPVQKLCGWAKVDRYLQAHAGNKGGSW